jgi:thioredoxin reductase
MYEYDVMIIGAGPIGMFASYIGSRMGLKIAILDKASVVGGQCIAIYPDKTIDDIPGMNLLARDLVKNLEIQMNLFPVDKYL